MGEKGKGSPQGPGYSKGAHCAACRGRLGASQQDAGQSCQQFSISGRKQGERPLAALINLACPLSVHGRGDAQAARGRHIPGRHSCQRASLHPCAPDTPSGSTQPKEALPLKFAETIGQQFDGLCPMCLDMQRKVRPGNIQAPARLLCPFQTWICDQQLAKWVGHFGVVAGRLHGGALLLQHSWHLMQTPHSSNSPAGLRLACLQAGLMLCMAIGGEERIGRCMLVRPDTILIA